EIAAPPFSRVSSGIRLVLRQGYSWISVAQRQSKVRLSAGGPKKTEGPMAQFVVVATLSGRGIKNVRPHIDRGDAFKHMAKKAGVTVKDIYWTLGSRDIVAICDAPDDEAATVLALSVSSRGNVRSETLRAFSFDEMKMILGKLV